MCNSRKALITSLFVGALVAGRTSAQFTSDGVQLLSQIPLSGFAGNPGNGNDCWGYVSSSGREYALMGISNALVVVEITTPSSPMIIAYIPHTDSLWGDIKTYLDYAYVVNEAGGGMDIVDLLDVDNGNVSLVQSFTGGGFSDAHNVAIDTDSGYLYLGLPNINGARLVAYDLADPENPALAGMMSSVNGGDGLHDLQVVTFTSGPHAGKQICFGAGESRGLDIIDVTNKSNMVRLSRTVYPNLSYAHQCWLGEDGQYLYLNDETDGVNETLIFDVTDLATPVLVNTYNSGVEAADHNLYIRDGFIYEAEYTTGVRIFCADDPVNPVQVGWFDTFPENNGGGFSGAWSVYPFFPSGNVIISDENRGLFVVDPSDALENGALLFDYPQGRPATLVPQGGTSVRVEVAGVCGASAAAGTGLLHYDDGGGFVSVPMEVVSENVYDAVFPALDCPVGVSYYVSAETAVGTPITDPPDAPATTYNALSASGETVVLEDTFETDEGWIPVNLGATSGNWQRGVPVDDPDWAYDPSSDADGSGQCYLTQNELGNTDVDNGAVRLTSPLLDMTGENASISYAYYLRLTNADGSDMLLVEISSSGDAGPWTEIARHDTSGGSTWRLHRIFPDDFQAAGVTLTRTMKVRFTANDADQQSIVEAGLDAFKIIELQCTAIGDLDGDGIVGIVDFLALLAAWGPCDNCDDCPADLDGDCEVGITDFLLLLANWT